MKELSNDKPPNEYLWRPTFCGCFLHVLEETLHVSFTHVSLGFEGKKALLFSLVQVSMAGKYIYPQKARTLSSFSRV